MIVFKNWFIEDCSASLFMAPELIQKMLVGNVYGHPKFHDGAFIHTSPIVGIEDMETHKDIITRSGSRYSVFPEDVDPLAEKAIPDYYNRLKMVEAVK